jgi:aspartate dehydrogenase
MKVGLIGCGNIGTEIALFIEKNTGLELKYLCDINVEHAQNLKKAIGNGQEVIPMEELIEKSDLIIESASRDAVKDILKSKNLDRKGKKLMLMSTGGIIGCMDAFKQIKNCEIYTPSGAIAGLDGIKAASGKINALTLTTTKPVQGLKNAPFIVKNNVDLDNLKNKKIIFQGNIEEAIAGFPQNINVAATLFLASKFDDIKISIIADPDAKTNTHEIFCEGDFGRMEFKTENLPSRNPKTSYLAVLSAIQTLRSIESSIKIGD